MTSWQRIRHILGSIFMIIFALTIILAGEDADETVIFAYTLVLTASGLRQLFYYFTMASKMVGGKRILYRGILFTDLGLLTAGLGNVPDFYVFIYLCGTMVFSGTVDIMNALESKKIGGSYRLRLSMGVVSILTAVLSLLVMDTPTAVAYIYGLGLIYNACIRIINALRPTAIIAIQ